MSICFVTQMFIGSTSSSYEREQVIMFYQKTSCLSGISYKYDSAKFVIHGIFEKDIELSGKNNII